MGPNGPIPLVRGDVWDEQSAVPPADHDVSCRPSPFRAVHTINLETMKLEHVVVGEDARERRQSSYTSDNAQAHVKILCAKDQGYNVTLNRGVPREVRRPARPAGKP